MNGRLRRILTWSLIAVAGLGVLCVVALSVLDSVAHSRFEFSATEAFTVPVDVSGASVDVFGQNVVFNQLRIDNVEGYEAEHAIKVSRMEVDLKFLSLLGNEVVIHKVACSGVEVNLELGDGRTNIDALLQRIKDKPETKDAKKLRIGTIALENGRVQLPGLGNTGASLPPVTIKPGEEGEALSVKKTVFLTATMLANALLNMGEEALPTEHMTALADGVGGVLQQGAGLLEEMGAFTGHKLEVGNDGVSSFMDGLGGEDKPD